MPHSQGDGDVGVTRPVAGIPAERYRHVLGHFATGVAVVTTKHESKPIGMTVQAFSALSLDPPMVLFCARRGSRSWSRIEAVGHLCVNLLSQDQEQLAMRFATTKIDKFESVAWTPSEGSGSPILTAALAWIDCRIVATHPGGDHQVVICEVNDLGAEPSRRPLLFYRSEYQKLG
ncbi:MAG: flavin reductase family protein [Candidatus Dormibacteraceae bacterium]